MNIKIMAVLVIALVIIASYILFSIKTPAQIQQVTASDNSAEISSVLGEQYSSMIEEELNKLSIEQTDFISQSADNIASDTSLFYY
jgi:uncharacterized membrane protein